MILDAHGLQVRLPHGWSGRIFNRTAQAATLHVANFALPLQDGEFGDRSTAQMRAGTSFFALTEYSPGAGLQPGRGLFAPRRWPRHLDPAGFSAAGLAHPRPGQAGVQHFFTAAGRPFCLYAVVCGHRSHRRGQLAQLDHVLASLKIAPRSSAALD